MYESHWKLALPHQSEKNLKHSISLWKENLLEEDENMKVMSSYLFTIVIFQTFLLSSKYHLGDLTIVFAWTCSWILKMKPSFLGWKKVEFQGSVNYQASLIGLKTCLLQNWWSFTRPWANGEAKIFFFESLLKGLGGHPILFQTKEVILL